MEHRFFDLLYVLLLVLLTLTSGGLIAYAAWNIGMRLMRATHVFLTCWDYHAACRKGDDLQRRLLLADPVMRAILRVTSPLQTFCPAFAARQRQLQRLEEYRFSKLQKGETNLIWDERLAALLTRDEYDFLYGAVALPSAT
ncbi:MAG TPA: hypothetical protein VG826_19810 [Pirellulales bacterium]|nr:hypothetical protein [Pirellulales bacterium]